MKNGWHIVSLGIARVSANELVSKMRNSVTLMTDNPAFMEPNRPPAPSLAQVTTIIDQLAEAEQTYAFNSGKIDKVVRDMNFQTAKQQYHLLGRYVQGASNGDKAIILSAGMEVVRRSQPSAVPPPPQNVRAASTHVHGQIILRYGASKGHRVYKIYRTLGDPSLETGWEQIGQTGKVRFVVSGLARFTTYSFRVIAEGVAGASIPSEAASATAA